MNHIQQLLPDTITVPRTDPIYNCHSYLTKVPIGAIAPFIEAFCPENGVVADVFAGSGMTGLAALTTGRSARLSDISELGQHIAKGYLQELSAEELRDGGRMVIDQAKKAIGNLYHTKRASDGAPKDMVRFVWSFTYICPSCDSPLVYFDHLDKNGKPPKSCPSCRQEFIKRLWPRGEDVPVRVVVDGEDKKQVEQHVTVQDIKRINKARRDKRQQLVPSRTIDATREMYSRSGLGKAGMTETSLFFSARNALALYELWNAINAIKKRKLKQKLRFAFTAILPRASRRYQWSAKRPLNAQNQTYYIAPVHYEWNIFELFERKVNAAIKANAYLFESGSLFADHAQPEVRYDIVSADNLKHLDAASIDYVFTDPPFGSNIFYSDMNLFHEAWLGKVTNHKKEAVVHTTGKKKTGAQERYEALLRDAFHEVYRVLKPGKYMSVVFGNSRGKIWGLVQRAIRAAGFKATPVHVAILDKGQRSVKGLNSGTEGVVTVDLILTVQKPIRGGGSAKDEHQLKVGDTAKLIKAAIRELPAAEADNPSHVYARILRKAIQEGMVLDELHLSDVLIALRQAGYSIDPKTGKLVRPVRRSPRPAQRA